MSDSPTQTPEWGALTSGEAQSNEKWWPNQLKLGILHQDHPSSNPFGADFDYRSTVADIDFDELTRDVDALMTDSKDWWPADWGHYGGLFIRMSWHAAGTYRVQDGRGGAGNGAQRFAPLNSWPDNGNLDKARRLLQPIKQKYGRAISDADLFVFAGNRALETMGFKTFGFAFGRADIWAPEDDVYWGPENVWLDDKDERYTGSFETNDRTLDSPLAAVQMGLIYVNPRGPQRRARRPQVGHGHPRDLQPDGHERRGDRGLDGRRSYVRQDARQRPAEAVGVEPEGAGMADQNFGWINSHETGLGQFTVTSGLEGAWTPTPTQWDNKYLETIFSHEWELVESPAGAKQWQPTEVKEGFMVPPVAPGAPETKPTMSTADMAMITDPAYLEISKRFYENPDQLADAFARAWFKLLHRDMGPAIRYVGPQVPDEELVWQDNVPAHEGPMIGDAEIADLKSTILDSGLTTEQLVSTAWASASTYRKTDYRGGANGARIRLSPQADWDVNIAGRCQLGHRQAGRDPGRVQRQGRPAGLPGRPDRPGRYRRRRGRSLRCRPRHQRAVQPGPDRRRPGEHRRRVVLLAGAESRRVPQLRGQGRPRPNGAHDGRQGVHAEPVGSGDDRPHRRPPGARRQRRQRRPRRVHRPSRSADQRLLHQPARHGHQVERRRRGRGRVRGSRPGHRRAEVDRLPASTWCSARTASSGPWPRSTGPPAARSCSSTTSSMAGSRS